MQWTTLQTSQTKVPIITLDQVYNQSKSPRFNYLNNKNYTESELLNTQLNTQQNSQIN